MRVQVLGHPKGDQVAFLKALRSHCRKLSIDLEIVRRRDRPAVTVVFPPSPFGWKTSDASLHGHLTRAELPVLPIVSVADDAKDLPKSLKRFNAFQQELWGAHWVDGLVDEVLSLAWLKRQERRVFVSYKRTDSELIASQVYDALTRRGYVTFLDDVSIPKGLDFQGELKWWLNDADLLLVLLSPNFEDSRWCMEEIAFAQGRAIPLVVIEWPDSVYTGGQPFAGAATAPTRPSVQKLTSAEQRRKLFDGLARTDFDGSQFVDLWERKLTEAALHEVMALCARQRSEAIARRVEDLAPFAREMLNPSVDPEPLNDVGDYKYSFADGTTSFVRVLPHRPSSNSLHAAFAASTGDDVVGCFYSECDPNDKRAVALRWMADAPRETGGAKVTQTRLWAYAGDEEVK